MDIGVGVASSRVSCRWSCRVCVRSTILSFSEQRISFIENSLQRGMEHLYKEGLNTKNADIVANCLRTYAAIDR